jgi:hypothetical protein
MRSLRKPKSPIGGQAETGSVNNAQKECALMATITQPIPRETKPSLARQLAAFFLSRPNQWVDCRQVAAVAGAYAWRTRISDLRRAPFNMTIENRQRPCAADDGTSFVISEYRFIARTSPCRSSR